MFQESLGAFYPFPWPAPIDGDGTFGIGFLRTNYKFRLWPDENMDASDRLIRDVLMGVKELKEIARRKR